MLAHFSARMTPLKWHRINLLIARNGEAELRQRHHARRTSINTANRITEDIAA
ncbi:hypothetical protein [Paraburkholderia ultramafica]|uniref:hypothetical protein n=1 Tax=Paraburkholderia ultramafica TaxID=1544867 RepID=UPI001582392C|nr:hypothetical protein [Paraburkholderia ultramafica]